MSRSNHLFLRIRRIGCTALIACVALPVIAQQKSPVAESVIDPVAVDIPGSQVRIMSITHGPIKLISELTVKNVSEKTIEAYEVGWALAVPPGCSQGSTATTVGSDRPDRVSISPGGQITTKNYSLGVREVLIGARQQNAKFLQAQIAIIRVMFSDGTGWAPSISPNQVFDDVELAKASQHCQSGTLRPLISSCPPRPVDLDSDFISLAADIAPSAGISPKDTCYYICQDTGNRNRLR